MITVRDMGVRIQLRNDLAINWSTKNPILAQGEIGIESDSRKLKIGDVYRDWETDRKRTRLNSSHSAKSRMPSSA